MRQVIEQDLALCESNLSKLVNVSKGVNDPDICRKLYNKVMSDLLNGESIKDRLLDDKSKFEKYDQHYNSKKGG